MAGWFAAERCRRRNSLAPYSSRERNGEWAARRPPVVHVGGFAREGGAWAGGFSGFVKRDGTETGQIAVAVLA